MFKGRRVRKSSRNRRPWYRPRTKRKNTVIKTTQADKYDFNDGYRINSDDIVVGSFYQWHTMIPIGPGNYQDEREPIALQKSKRLLSLKLICIDTITANIDSLQPSYLDYGPMSCWLLIWESVMLHNQDSFRIFSIFASKYHDCAKFKSHKITPYIDKVDPAQLILNLRNKAIDLFKIPNCIHRIEPLFLNINLGHFSKYLASLPFTPLIVLDLLLLGSTAFLEQTQFDVFNIPNLAALNLSNNRLVDDRFLFNLSSCIKKGKLSKLSLIILNNCPNVTIEGIQYLLSLEQSNSCLVYIETDNKLKTSSFNRKFEGLTSNGVYIDYIENSQWFKLDRERYDIELIRKLPLALKLNSLCRLFSKYFIPESNPKFDFIQNLKENVIVDFMIHPETFQPNSGAEHLMSAWTSRINQRSNTRTNGYCYMINNNCEKFRILKQEKSIAKSDKSYIEKDSKLDQSSGKVARTKSKSIKIDAGNFFAM